MNGPKLKWPKLVRIDHPLLYPYHSIFCVKRRIGGCIEVQIDEGLKF